MYYGCAKPDSRLRRVGEVAHENGVSVYVAITYENPDGSVRALEPAKVRVLNTLFNERLRTPGKKILILPDLFDLYKTMSYGEIMIDFGLTSMERGTLTGHGQGDRSMKLSELAGKLDLKGVTEVFDKEITGVYISDMVSDVIANAKAGNLLVTVQIHSNVIAAANLVDLAGIVVTQGKRPPDDVVKMAEKAKISLFTTDLNRWQVATKLYEAGVR